jgi:hypothetical protein
MKAPRGRPKLNCQVRQVRVTLSLREGEDDDLLMFFTDIPNGQRAAALKIALRVGGVSLFSAAPETNDDIDRAVQGFVFG